MLVVTLSDAVASGPRQMGDTASYAMWAERLIASGFSFPAIVAQQGSALSLTYALFVTLVAALQMILGEGWRVGLVAVNVAAVSAVGVLLARLTHRLTGSGTAAWTALLLFAGSWDMMQWVPALGSDASFLLFAYGVFLLEAARILSGRGTWLPVFAAAAAASLYRPTGIVLLPITGWSFFLARTRGASSAARAAVLAVLIGLGAAGAGAMAWVWQNPARWPVGFARREIELIADTYAQGQVVWDRPETYHAIPVTAGDHLLITGDRLLHFFAVGAADYSAAHWLVNLSFYGFVYLAAASFVWRLCSGRAQMVAGERDACFAVLGAVVAYALFHAVVQVDYDWRYRLPIMPHLILLAAAGVAEWLGSGRRSAHAQ